MLTDAGHACSSRWSPNVRLGCCDRHQQPDFSHSAASSWHPRSPFLHSLQRQRRWRRCYNIRTAAHAQQQQQQQHGSSGSSDPAQCSFLRHAAGSLMVHPKIGNLPHATPYQSVQCHAVPCCTKRWRPSASSCSRCEQGRWRLSSWRCSHMTPPWLPAPTPCQALSCRCGTRRSVKRAPQALPVCLLPCLLQ